MNHVVRKGQSHVLPQTILASPKLSEAYGEEEGLPILSRPLSTETRSMLMKEIASIEHALSSQHTSKEIDEARAMMASSMVSTRSDDAEASIEAAAWSLVLGDEEMCGRIPGWVIKAAVREYMLGVHGKYFPKATEFLTTCKSIIAKYRWAAKERERLLTAKVVKLPTSASRLAAKDIEDIISKAFKPKTVGEAR